jgi:hypothetical protein
LFSNVQFIAFKEYAKMKAFEKQIPLYKCYLKKEGLAELDRLTLENMKVW